MRPVYAAQFQIQSSADASATFDEVRKVAAAWVTRWYKEWRQFELELTVDGLVATPFDGHRVEVVHAAASSGERLWTLSWNYPADADDRLLWRSEFTLALVQGQIEVAFVLRIGSRDFTIAPASFDIRRPYLVKSLLENFSCRLGSRPLRSAAISVGLDDIEALGAWLRSRERRLPVIIFSRDPYSERCLASPARAADALAGLAEIVVLNDKWASFRLTEELGKTLSCFNGAVRLYWPATGGEFRADRPFMPEELGELADGVIERLLRRLAPVSAFRFVEMATIQAARAALDRDRLKQFQALRDSSTAAQDQFDWLVNENTTLRDAKQRAEEDLDDVRLRVLELQEEVAQHQENLRLISAHAPVPISALKASVVAEPATVRSRSARFLGVSRCLAHCARQRRRLGLRTPG